jgi:hypothetical protein
MKRREFISLLGGAAAWPVAARAQQARVYTIGDLTLTGPNPEPLLKALREGLADAGYVEGRNLRLEIRSAQGRPDLQLEKAAELVRRSTIQRSVLRLRGRSCSLSLIRSWGSSSRS